MKIPTNTLMAALIALGVAAPSQASLIFTLQQSAGNVVASGSGTVNTAGLAYFNTVISSSQFLRASAADFVIGSGAILDIFTGLTGPSNFGSGGNFNSALGSGNKLGLDGPSHRLYLPQNYQSGNQLSGTATWSGATFSSLGLTPGIYTWTWGSGGNADSATLTISDAPEPATLALLAAGLAGLARARRQRRGAA